MRMQDPLVFRDKAGLCQLVVALREESNSSSLSAGKTESEGVGYEIKMMEPPPSLIRVDRNVLPLP